MILRVGSGGGCWCKGPLTTAAGAVGFRWGRLRLLLDFADIACR